MTTTPTTGIHHITAIASDPARIYSFYAELLGLRLVKKTVNQDDVSAYHLFFGDTEGHPGMDVTFFTFQPIRAGLHGLGQVDTISLTIPASATSFWQQRLTAARVTFEEKVLFELPRLQFVDHDGQKIELVAVPDFMLPSDTHVWETPEITNEHAIRCFYGARLGVAQLSSLEPVLRDVLGYSRVAQEGDTTQYSLAEGKRAVVLELMEQPWAEVGVNAAGTVHHIAFGVVDEDHQLEMRKRVIEIGLYPTEVIDRFYFKSVYFKTQAGILFELATLGPGFTADEPLDSLGENLSLPPFLEDRREGIEADLPPIKI